MAVLSCSFCENRCDLSVYPFSHVKVKCSKTDGAIEEQLECPQLSQLASLPNLLIFVEVFLPYLYMHKQGIYIHTVVHVASMHARIKFHVTKCHAKYYHICRGPSS